MKRPTKRSKRRVKMVFVCVLYAHRELEIPHDPKDIASRINLPLNEISTALSENSEFKSGYKPKTTLRPPKDFIILYAERLGLNEGAVTAIIEIVENVDNRNNTFKNILPQTIAAGAIRYYLDTYGVKIDQTLFHSVVRTGEGTILDMSKKIASIDNQL